VASVAFPAFNYFELKGDYYYPQLLLAAPMCLALGVIGLTNPRLDVISSGKKKAFLAFAAFVLVLGWFFEKWFVSTFGAH
jgi:hypothetical protein